MFRISGSIGKQFEEDLAEEFGLRLVPGSGNQWHSKLDVHGRGARWSLKATEKASASIKASDIQEAIHACLGLDGDGTIPLWAYRIQDHDMVMLRKEDFIELQKGEMNVIETESNTKMEQKRLRSQIPELLRDE